MQVITLMLYNVMLLIFGIIGITTVILFTLWLLAVISNLLGFYGASGIFKSKFEMFLNRVRNTFNKFL